MKKAGFIFLLSLFFAVKLFSQESSFETFYKYDSKGFLIEEKSSNGKWRKFEYDEKGRKKTEKTSSGNQIFYEYDSEDRITRVVYSDKKIPSLCNEYNEKNQKIKQVYFDGSIWSYKYDSTGKKVHITTNFDLEV